jgi:hypothetical protein
MARLYVLAFVCLAACVGSGDETVLIMNNQVAAAGCALSGSADGTQITSGVIESQPATDYVFTPLLKNFSSAEDEATARRHIAFTEGAHVTITFDDPDLQPSSTDFTQLDVPFSARIEADSVAQVSFPIVPHQLIDDVGASLQPGDPDILMRVDVQIYGNINDSSFETQTFHYPVEICAGCTYNSVGFCSDFPPTVVFTHLGGGCNAYQDAELDCCDDGTGALVCPAVGTMTTLQ